MKRMPILSIVLLLGIGAGLLATHAAAATEIKMLTADPNVAVVRGFFREYAVDHLRSGPAIVAVDEDDDVWVAMARSGKLVRFRNDRLQSFEIGQDSRPVAIAIGTARNGHPNTIWISAAFDEKLVRFDKLTGAIRKYSLGEGTMWPFMVDLGPAGEVWFTQRASGRIGRLDSETGAVQHFALPTENAGPAGLAIDPRTGMVWFTQGQADRIGRLDPRNGQVTDYVMGDQSTGMTSGPAGIAIAPDGGVWFAKLEGKLGRVDPSTGGIELIEVPEAARRPAGITVGPDGNIWSVALDGNSVLRFEPGPRRFTIYPLPTGTVDAEPSNPPAARTARPFGLAFDSRGNLWFSEQYTGQLGVLALAPPALRVASPIGDVNAHDPFVTLAAFDRVSGIESIEYRLDGRPVALSAGRLSLLDCQPGPHRLTITATNRAGFSSTVSSGFRFAPNGGTLSALIDALEPTTDAGRAAQNAARGALNRDPQDSGRSEALQSILERLAASPTEFAGFPLNYVQSLTRYFRVASTNLLEVKVLDQQPWFSPAQLSVRTGDTVTWRYDPPSQGHILPQHPNRIQIESDRVMSPLLRAGESFAYQFARVGAYAVTNPDRPEARLVVEVVQ